MNEILYIQDKGRNEIDQQLAERNHELDIRIKRHDEKRISLEKDSKTKINEIKKDYANYLEKVNYKVKKENTNIKTILGVYILQNYFINSEIETGFDEGILKNNYDFKQFIGGRVLVVDDKDAIVSTIDYPKEHSFTTPISLNKEDHHHSHLSKINLSDLKSKHDAINLTFDELFEFFKKLTSKNESFKNSLNSLNLKQINLEIIKDRSVRRVNEILTKNKANNLNLAKLFEQNSKFKAFMQTFTIEPRDYIKEINDLIANNEIQTLETDFYDRSIDFISNFKIVFESLYNR